MRKILCHYGGLSPKSSARNMHTYIRTYIHTYLPAYIPTYLHTYIPTYLHTYIHTYIHTCMHTYIHTYIYAYAYAYAHAHAHAHAHARARTRIYRYRYIYIYKPCFCSDLWSLSGLRHPTAPQQGHLLWILQCHAERLGSRRMGAWRMAIAPAATSSCHFLGNFSRLTHGFVAILVVHLIFA